MKYQTRLPPKREPIPLPKHVKHAAWVISIGMLGIHLTRQEIAPDDVRQVRGAIFHYTAVCEDIRRKRWDFADRLIDPLPAI